jgi:hypothetical protein
VQSPEISNSIHERRRKMPELTVAVQVSEVAKAIKIMNKEEIETLTLLLTEEGTELLARKMDLEQNKATFISREDVFDL